MPTVSPAQPKLGVAGGGEVWGHAWASLSQSETEHNVASQSELETTQLLAPFSCWLAALQLPFDMKRCYLQLQSYCFFAL